MKLQTRENNLPVKIDELAKFVLIGREKLVSVRAEIKAINKLGLAKDVRQQKKDEAQLLAGALLDAEAKIGEMLKEIPKASGGYRKSKETKIGTAAEFDKTKMKTVKELGFNQTQAERFETLAENKDIIEQVKAEAKESDDLPTRTEVLRRVAEKKREQRNEELKDRKLVLGNDIFQVIYVDPPWQYNNSGFQMSAENKYPTMSIDQLEELKVNKISDSNSVMFMWATNPLLKDAIYLMNKWGFEYKTNFVWVKKSHTAGFYVFGQHELLLIGIKGSLLPTGEKPKSIIYGNNKIHSQKPEEVYEIIESMYPGLKYVELFARNDSRKGWVKLGNEVGKYEK